MLYSKILLCSFLLFAGMSVNGQAVKADTVKILTQNWKIQELYLHSFKEDEKEELDDFIRTTLMQFNTDGSFITKSDTVIIKGKWRLDGQTVTVEMDEGDSFSMKILEFSPHGLRFESGHPSSKKIFSAGILAPVKGIIAPLPTN